MNVYQGILEYTSLRIFIDSRFISIIVNRRMKNKNNFTPVNSTKWSTQEGKFMTNSMVKVELSLPVLITTKILIWECHMDDYTVGS